jgi:hypothetical protein
MGEPVADAGFHRFRQRVSVLPEFQKRKPVWIKHEDLAKASKMFDLMPHPDLDIHNLAE